MDWFVLLGKFTGTIGFPIKFTGMTTKTYFSWIGFVGEFYWFKSHDLHGKIYGFRLGFS